MDYKKVTFGRGETLENGSYRLEVTAQMNDTYHVFQNIVLITQKDSQNSLPQNVGTHFISVLLKTILGLGSRVFMSSTNNGNLRDKIVLSSIKPRHSIMYDSVTYDRCGSFRPLPKPFSTNPTLEPSIVQRHACLLSTYYTNAFAAWKHANNVDVHVAIQSNVFDLQGTQFVAQDHRRPWVIQRTITRQMAQELEQQLCGPIRPYKGVRWRPERKHPWVAEIRLHKQKKAWIGNFDTQEEAARAFDVAAIYHGKHTTLNFKGSRDLVPPTQLYIQPAN